MHNLMSRTEKTQKYSHFIQNCPLKLPNVLPPNETQLLFVPPGRTSKNKPKFVQDSVDFSSVKSLAPKRRFQKVVTMPMPSTNDYYRKTLKSELARPQFVNDAVKSSYKQQATNGRYKLGAHDHRASKSDPLLPRYEPIDDKLIKGYFKKPQIKRLISKTMPHGEVIKLQA